MKLDLRTRCARQRCRKIPRGKMQTANYEHYKPYCSFHCQEWARVEDGLTYCAELRRAAEPAK